MNTTNSFFGKVRDNRNLTNFTIYDGFYNNSENSSSSVMPISDTAQYLMSDLVQRTRLYPCRVHVFGEGDSLLADIQT